MYINTFKIYFTEGLDTLYDATHVVCVQQVCFWFLPELHLTTECLATVITGSNFDSMSHTTPFLTLVVWKEVHFCSNYSSGTETGQSSINCSCLCLFPSAASEWRLTEGYTTLASKCRNVFQRETDDRSLMRQHTLPIKGSDPQG